MIGQVKTVMTMNIALGRRVCQGCIQKDIINHCPPISRKICVIWTMSNAACGYRIQVPVSISLQLNALTEPTSCSQSKINWPKSIDRGKTLAYAVEVSKIVLPLLFTENHSISKLNQEILAISRALLKAASTYLPAISHHKKMTLIEDERLRRLCKESHEAWMKWKSAGRPSEGSLHEKKRSTKRLILQRVAFCRARLKCAKIQARDLMFKENNHHRFKYPQNRYECKSLLIDA